MQIRFAMPLIFGASVCCVAMGQNPPAQAPPAQQSSNSQTQAQPQTAPQQPASLADVARKYREEKAEKEKNGAQPGTLYTNEGVIPKSGTNAFGTAPVANSRQQAGRGAAAGSSSTPNFAGTIAKLDDAFEKLNELAALDRATLVKAVLQEDDVNFPGRSQWEERLMAGRDAYVVRGRQLNRGMKQLLMQAKALQDANPNLSDDDPRAQSFMSMVAQATAEAKKTSDDFQNLMDQGRALARQALGRGN